MNSHRLSGLLTAVSLVVLAWPSIAGAQDEDGKKKTESIVPYIEYRLGLAVVRNQNLSTGTDSMGNAFSGSVRPEAGFAVGGAAGARFLEYFRAELGIDYRLNDNDDAGIGVGGSKGADGDLSLLTIMSNVYVDYDLDIGVIPFAGIGIGWGLYRIDSKSSQIKLNDTDSVFAWNVMAGGTYPVTDITELTLGYRYVATEDPTVEATINGVGKRWVDTEYDSHEVYFGLRFKF